MRYNTNSTSYNLAVAPVFGKWIVETTTAPGTLFAFGLNFKTAPVEIREKLYLDEGEIRIFLDAAKERLAECMVVSTCNRTEIYAVSNSAEIDLEFFKNVLVDIKDAHGLVRDEHFFALISCAACQQLFNVATSIDSRVIGDSQILRQLRSAYSVARAYGYTGKILNQLVQRAFKLGKTTYTETAIHDGTVSVSLAAVEQAVRTFGSLRGHTALVIGAGETARLTAEALIKKRIGKIIFTNRTKSHAAELLSDFSRDLSFDGEVRDFELLGQILPDADIVISSTGSSEPILYERDFSRQSAKTLVIDIAVPRDIDESVANNELVILKNIDDLNIIIDENHDRRLADLPKVKKMIVKEMVDFLTWYYLLPIMPAYRKTGAKPSAEQKAEILQIKELLVQHVPEIHRLASQAGGDFRQDLSSHHELINKLRTVKAAKFGELAV
jgi:glutamyl-tRNA reductase